MQYSQSGMKVWQLCELLDKLGYALPVLGNVTVCMSFGVEIFPKISPISHSLGCILNIARVRA